MLDTVGLSGYWHMAVLYWDVASKRYSYWINSNGIPVIEYRMIR